MNPTQIQTTLAPVIAVLAGMLAQYFHVFDAGGWTQLLLWVASGGSIIWGALAARKTSLISTTANMTEVKSITLHATAPSLLVEETPANVTK